MDGVGLGLITQHQRLGQYVRVQPSLEIILVKMFRLVCDYYYFKK